jgi:hypothetical protein
LLIWCLRRWLQNWEFWVAIEIVLKYFWLINWGLKFKLRNQFRLEFPHPNSQIYHQYLINLLPYGSEFFIAHKKNQPRWNFFFPSTKKTSDSVKKFAKGAALPQPKVYVGTHKKLNHLSAHWHFQNTIHNEVFDKNVMEID